MKTYTITLTENAVERIFDLISHVRGTEYLAFIDNTETELGIPFNADDDERVEQALNDTEFSHPYLWAVIAKRALDDKQTNKTLTAKDGKTNREIKTMTAKSKLKIRQAKREQFVEDYIRYFLSTGIALNRTQSKKVIKQFYS